MLITARKACHRLRGEEGHRRGGGWASAAGPTELDEEAAGIEQIISKEPSPEFAVEIAEQYELLLVSLDDGELKSIALWRMEGFTSNEIPSACHAPLAPWSASCV